jgi:hypothetical protein
VPKAASFSTKTKGYIVASSLFQPRKLGSDRADTKESIDNAARSAGAMFYGAGTYGYYGYVFADLGPAYEYMDEK